MLLMVMVIGVVLVGRLHRPRSLRVQLPHDPVTLHTHVNARAHRDDKEDYKYYGSDHPGRVLTGRHSASFHLALDHSSKEEDGQGECQKQDSRHFFH